MFLIIARSLSPNSCLTSLLNCLPYLVTCQYILRPYVSTCLACLRAHVPTWLACLRAHVPCVLTCSRVEVPCVLTYSSANVSCLLTYSCVNVSCVPKCSRAITSNDKNKFSICYTTTRNVSRNIYFENSIVHSGISLTRRKPLTGAMTNFVQ